ncbi:MAG: hypothetical protein KDA75_15745, partial [Planctomycetaceae bacterium]|nr:hypothetical protein [Planctomycetaceae bacterium]
SGQEWKARAHEQLVLMYLRDKDRWGDAKTELQTLQTVTGASGSAFAAKGRAAEAILAAYQHQRQLARDIVSQNRAQLQTHGLIPGGETPPEAGGSWRRLLADAMRLVNDENRPDDNAPNSNQ